MNKGHSPDDAPYPSQDQDERRKLQETGSQVERACVDRFIHPCRSAAEDAESGDYRSLAM